MASKIRADCMTVLHTAEWILTFGRYFNWNAAVYTDNFAQNDIWGHLLPKLTFKTLQSDLGIVNEEHRLMMMAIKYFFSSMLFTDAKMSEIETTESPKSWTPSWASEMDNSQSNGPSEQMDCD